MNRFLLSSFAILLVASATVVAADVDLDGVKCVVANKGASESKSADYKDGKVYFCCNGCAGKFAKSPKKFAAKANMQLVATKQYKQTGCPISGKGINDSVFTTVAGTKVSFCCGGCKSKVENAKDDKVAMKLVFSDRAFAKGFKKNADEE